MAAKSTRLPEMDATSLLRRSLRQPQTWPVGVYEFDGETITDVSSTESRRRRYTPLSESPDLFLSFACLYESTDFAAHAVKWVGRYGLVVQEGAESAPSIGLEELHAHAYRAWDTLVHYEALIRDDPARALYAPGGALNQVYDENRSTEVLPGSDRQKLALVSERARQHAQRRVSGEVNERCYLRALDHDNDEQAASEWTWGFYDLLGAMYLQMMVLMERAMRVGRCKQCGTAFSEKKSRDEHSPRRRVFCTNACRMAYKRAQ